MSNDFRYNAPTFFDFASHLQGENTANIESYFDTDHEFNKEVVKYEQEIEIKEQVVEHVEENKKVVKYECEIEIKEEENVLSGAEQHIQLEHDVEIIEEIIEHVEEDMSSANGTEHENNQVGKPEHEMKIITDQFPEDAFTIEESVIEIRNKNQRMPRRSLSTGNLFHVNGQNVIVTNKSGNAEKLQSSTKLRRSASRNTIYNLAKPKLINSHVSKFISMAEAVNKYYSKTPERFHSKNTATLNFPKKYCNVTTIPNSPHLMTKQRARPTHVLSQKQLEEKEIEDAKKFKIKAHPINPKVFQGPVKPVHAKRLTTVIEPFKLTECTAKLNIKSPEPFEFHAKPVPKSVYTTPKTIPKVSVKKHATPKLPQHNGAEEAKKQQAADKEHAVKLFVPAKTQPVPFSFEKRDKEIIKKKEEQINKVLEEEKKAREFHAKPPPKYLNAKRHNGSVMSVKFTKSEEDVNFAVPVFKARPPTVLYKKPFEPKRAETTLVEITEFELNTERRAKNRLNFENELKKREENIAELKKQAEERLEEIEKQQIAEMRKKAEYKANPIRHYKGVKIMPSQNVTIPVSPALRTAGLRNKENAK